MKKLSLINLFLLFIVLSSTAQYESGQKIPLIGTKAPKFKAPSTNGPISFPNDFGNNWKILFAHPRDFTPVCSSELLELAYLQDEFKALNADIIVISVDKLVSHQSWKNDLEGINYKERGEIKIDFPLVVDSSSSISYKYGMVDPGKSTQQNLRGVFFIDPQNIIRAFQFYPSEIGRNTHEILRIIKALQAHDRYKDIVTPGNWESGDDFMIHSLSPEDKEELKKADSKIHFINWYMIFKKEEE